MTVAVYQAYRNARIRWLPPVPKHWGEQRAKVFFREADERSSTGLEELLSVSHLTGVTPRSQKNVTMFKAASYVGHKLCRPGDIVVNTLWAWMGALGAARHAGLVSPAYGVYRLYRAGAFNPTYLDYLLRTRAYISEYNCRSTGIRSSRLRLYPNQFLDIPLICPPREEQDKIVKYLRAQDVDIARYIRAKKELLKLMGETRTVLTRQVITSEETQYLRLDTVASLLGEPIVRKSGETYVPIGMFNRGRGIFHKQPTLGKDLGDSIFYPVRHGDLILSGQFAWEGAVAVAQEADDGCVASHRYPIVKCKQGVAESVYLYSFFLTGEGGLLLNDHSRGAAGRNRPLNPRTLMKEKVPVPPLRLQKEITAYFSEELSVRRAVQMQISQILQYRDRLIANVVTGQMDVREMAAGLPDADEPNEAAGNLEPSAQSDDELETMDEAEA